MATWRRVAITPDAFQTPEGERFALAELSALHIVEQPAEASRRAVPWLRAASALVAVAAVIVAVRAWQVVRDYGILVGVLLVTSIASLIASDCLRAPVLVWELRAIYRGRTVCLLRTGSDKAMGRVCVALLRAFGSRSRHIS
jgi:hypothetical protein